MGFSAERRKQEEGVFGMWEVTGDRLSSLSLSCIPFALHKWMRGRGGRKAIEASLGVGNWGAA